jgi:superfamily I DNA/RNA helicase
MEKMEIDCSPAQDDLPLRQGDIFTWVDRARERPWRTFGMVITADCDLRQEKTKGQLSYLPMLTFEDYIWTFWRVEKFAPLLDRLRKKALDRLNNVLTRLKPNQKAISQDAGLAWISRTESAELAAEIGLEDPGQTKDFCVIIENYKLVEKLLGTIRPDMNLLNNCHAINRGAAPPSDFSELSREVQSKISSLPGDVFFISSVDGFENFGMFVMLRHITQCRVDDVAIRPEDLRWGNASARRVARVSILCLDEERFEAYVRAAENQYETEAFVIASRDDTERLRYSGRKFLLSTPEYVAGLQFDTVILIDANKSLVPDGSNTGYLMRRILSELYLGISRAERRLLIFASQDAGGISSLLSGVIAKGLLIESKG